MSTHVRQVSFRFTPEVRDALDAIKLRDGIPLSEQLRRAVALWLERKADPPPAAPPVPPARGRRRG